MCLRYECSDLGDTQNSSPSLKNLVSAVCSAMDEYTLKEAIAGYETDADVSELSRIDLDVLQIEIAMRTTAYNLANEIYAYGRNRYASITTFSKHLPFSLSYTSLSFVI